MRECIERISEYTAGEQQRFETSRLVPDTVIRNLQRLTESSQRLSDGIKASEPQALARIGRFSQCHRERYLGIDLTAVWLVVLQDLPPLAAAIDRMAARSREKT
jgi:uncharacterized protein with HEPN domain